MAGDAAVQAEEESNELLVAEMTSLLARIHGKELLPRPLQSIVTRWSKDPFARGSYSYVGPDATGDDYDLLGESIDQKLFFAGEATCRTHPATVHGAYMSGLRAATEVLETFIQPIEMPPEEVLIPKKNQPVRNPLVEKSGVSDVRRRNDPESHRYKAKNIKRGKFSKIVEACAARIEAELGAKPVAPKKYHPNAFLLFQKDKWDIAKDAANKGKFGGSQDLSDSVSRDEVRASMGRLWRDLPEDEKKVYQDTVEREKAQFKNEMTTFVTRLQTWEKGVAKIKEEIKAKLEEVEMTEEEQELIQAAREEEKQENRAKEEKENLRRFYGEVGVDGLLSDDDDDKAEV
jgi:lysine-specific histone demethylase 1